MLKIFRLGAMLSLTAFTPSKPEMVFCEGVKFIMQAMNKGEERNTLRGGIAHEYMYDSQIAFAGWDLEYITDGSSGFGFHSTTIKGNAKLAKEKFAEIRTQLVRCLNLNRGNAKIDKEDSFSLTIGSIDLKLTFNAESPVEKSFVEFSILKPKK
jgi:hypothetical protein